MRPRGAIGAGAGGSGNEMAALLLLVVLDAGERAFPSRGSVVGRLPIDPSVNARFGGGYSELCETGRLPAIVVAQLLSPKPRCGTVCMSTVETAGIDTRMVKIAGVEVRLYQERRHVKEDLKKRED